MSKPIKLLAVLLICAALLPASGSPFFSASAAPLTAVAPPLGTAKAFAVLGASTVTNTGATIVTGDLGVSPGTAVTGFPPGTVTGTTHTGSDAVAVQAQSDVTVAYNNLAGQSCDTDYGAGTKDLAGLFLVPGVYCAGDFGLSGTLTLTGNATDVWVFKANTTLITGIRFPSCPYPVAVKPAMCGGRSAAPRLSVQTLSSPGTFSRSRASR